jgi:hypothetical protein
MAANSTPIYIKNGNLSSNGSTWMAPTLTTAANDYTWISANNALVFTADATNGSYIKWLRFKAAGTNVATVARIYINNGSANGTAANNTFYWEITLPATTAVTNAATPDFNYPLGDNGSWLPLNTWFKIYVWLGANVAWWWVVSPTMAGDY